MPTGASSRSLCAAVPRATSTAPSRGIAVGPPFESAATGPKRSVFGVAGGNGAMTTPTVPGSDGVVAP